MKKIRLYTLVALLLMAGGVTMQAQEYSREIRSYHPLVPKSGEKQWDVKNLFIWGDVEYQVMRLGEEIELDGFLYREMTYENDDAYYSTGVQGAIREEDKKVYVRWWQPGLQYFAEEKLYYDFGLQVGDSFDVGYDTPYYIQVLAIEVVEIDDGSVRNKYVFDDGWDGQEVWIEGVGSLAGVHHRFEPDLMSSSISNLQCCFENDALVWTDGECWDEIEEDATEKVGLYPNPARDRVVIEGVETAEVEIYNALGQVVKRVKGSNEVGLMGLAEGVYLVRITDVEGKKHVARMAVK